MTLDRGAVLLSQLEYNGLMARIEEIKRLKEGVHADIVQGLREIGVNLSEFDFDWAPGSRAITITPKSIEG